MIAYMIAFVVVLTAFSVGLLIGLKYGRDIGFAEAERLVRINLGWLKGK